MIKIPRDVDIQPGQEFHEPAAQAANIDNLLKILGTKQSIEALTTISEVDKNTWKDISTTVTSLKDFALGGGISVFKDEVSTMIQENIQGALGPLYNELQPIINEVMRAIEPLMPFIIDIVKWATDILVPIIQWIADVLQDLIDIFTSDPGPIEENRFYRDLIYLGKIDPPALTGEAAGVGGRRRLEQEFT